MAGVKKGERLRVKEEEREEGRRKRGGWRGGRRRGEHLLKPVLGLEVRVVPSSDGSHGCRLISSVGLCGVFKV